MPASSPTGPRDRAYALDASRRPTDPLAEGENLVVDPPRRLVQTMHTLWSEEAEREGTSRVTWEIEPVGDSCRLTVTHDQLQRRRPAGALRRLADDPVRAEDLAGDRPDPDHPRLADVRRPNPQPRSSDHAARPPSPTSVRSRSPSPTKIEPLAFYVDTLGFEKRLDAPISPTMRWIEVAPPGADHVDRPHRQRPRAGTAARRRHRHPLHRCPTPRPSTPRCASVGVVVSDVMRWDGVPPMYTVDDPDGNRFYVVEEIR